MPEKEEFPKIFRPNFYTCLKGTIFLFKECNFLNYFKSITMLIILIIKLIFRRLLQPHKNRPSTTELCEIVTKMQSKLQSSNGHVDNHPIEAQNEHTNINSGEDKHEITTTEPESNSSATFDTTTIIESIQQVSVSMTATVNEKNINNQNDEHSASRENLPESFDADATGDDNNDSILASVASIDDKDKLIEFLTNKLVEKNRKECEMSQEIERLRNLLK